MSVSRLFIFTDRMIDKGETVGRIKIFMETNYPETIRRSANTCIKIDTWAELGSNPGCHDL
jgi:hypothetical protein